MALDERNSAAHGMILWLAHVLTSRGLMAPEIREEFDLAEEQSLLINFDKVNAKTDEEEDAK